MFHILQHLMKVSVEREAPAGLRMVAIYRQIILFVTAQSLYCTSVNIAAPSPIQPLYIFGVIVPTLQNTNGEQLCSL